MPSRATGTTRKSGVLCRVPAMFAVAAMMPIATDTMAAGPMPDDVACFAIGAIMMTIFLMWALMAAARAGHGL